MAGIGFGLVIVAAILAGITALLYFVFGLVWTLLLMFLFVCLGMIGVVLIQKPKGGGLTGAFGGAGGSSQAVFGAKVGDVLTWVTVGFFLAFLGLAMGLTYAIRGEVNAPVGITTLQAAAEAEAGLDQETATPNNPETSQTPDIIMDEPETQPVETPATPTE